MKNLKGPIFAIALCLAFSGTALAAKKAPPKPSGDPSGILIPVSKERITILPGDVATVTLGEKDGVVKGDVGTVLSDGLQGPDRYVGDCAITKSEYETSLCEMVRAKKEVDQGSAITFKPVSYTDGNLYPVAISLLSRAVKPYEPYRRVNICVYGIFDGQGAVTGLSESIKKEFESIFRQKKHVRLAERAAMNNIVFYPEETSGELLGVVENQMKKADIDVLLLGTYAIDQNSVSLTVKKIDRTNKTTERFLYSFPAKAEYGALASQTVLGKQPVTTTAKIESLIVLKQTASKLMKNEKFQSIKHESAGNPFIEQAMKRIDFNVVNPVEVTIKVDDEAVSLDKAQQHRLSLPEGSHKIAVSFKRGYYYNESLMYTSERETTKEALLDVHRIANLVVEVHINPLAGDMIAFDAYESGSNLKPVLKPIRRITSERRVETFKD